MNTWPEPAIFNATSTNVRGLNLVNTGGIIREDPLSNRPSIVFRASNPDLVRALTVNQNEGANGDTLELQFVSPMDVEGEYLLEIYMPTNSLQYVHAGDGGNTVVGPNTLIVDSSRDITIKSLGSGTIFVESENVGASFFTVEAESTGDIHINVNNILAADVIDLSSQSSGEISLLAGNTVASSLVTVAAGSGNVFVGNPTNDAASPSITATNLITKVFGDGNVVYLNEGSCDSSFVQTSGAGSAYVSAIKCRDTGAVLLETGNIYASSTESFAVDDRGTGEVYAIVDAATNVTGTYYPFPDAVATPTYTSLVVPDRTPTSIEIKGINSPPSALAEFAPAEWVDGAKALGGGSIAAIVLGLGVLIALAAIMIRRRLKARQPQLNKIDFVADTEFVNIATPVTEDADAKVLTMQSA